MVTTLQKGNKVKLIDGVLLAYIARKRSEVIEYEPAAATSGR